jgi:alpha-beta hydrolase superfamily lysophospholipase
MGSPLRYNATAVPTSLWYGTTDPMTPVEQTYELYKRLRQGGMRAQLVDLRGAPHDLTDLSSHTRDVVLGQLVTFLNQVFYQPISLTG